MAKVFVGVDPHKLSATIEVVDDKEQVLATGRFGGDKAVATGRFGTDKAGYAAMRRHVAGVSRPDVGGGGQQRRRPPVGAADRVRLPARLRPGRTRMRRGG